MKDGGTAMEKNIKCNACGRQIQEENGILKEDIFEGRKEWGYFSKKDLRIDTFYLCEECYERITADFVLPLQQEENMEVL